MKRSIHPDFEHYLAFKEAPLIKLYKSLRQFILSMYPDCNELLYHTHALTSIYSVTDKLGGGFVMLPIYTNHLNLGFHKGVLLNDTHQLLKGTGKLIRHIAIEKQSDFNNDNVRELIKQAYEIAVNEMQEKINLEGLTINKIKVG